MAEKTPNASWTLSALQRQLCSKCGEPGDFRPRHRQCRECERAAKREWSGLAWHYCQLDFDHVRGRKLGCVLHMGSKDAIRAEAAKCEVVCANCHRERTQQTSKGASRNDPADIDMVWKRRGKGLKTQVEAPADFVPYRLKTSKPPHRDWHPLAGTMTDAAVAEIGGVSKSMVCIYRKRMGIPSFSKQGRNGGPRSFPLNSEVSYG